jgi:hypothetical protein
MIRLLKSVYCFAFINAFVFAIQSCKKDEQIRPIDPTIEKYFGDWKFTKTKYRNSWDYVPDSKGSTTVVHSLVTSKNWEKTGGIYMGR